MFKNKEKASNNNKKESEGNTIQSRRSTLKRIFRINQRTVKTEVDNYKCENDSSQSSLHDEKTNSSSSESESSNISSNSTRPLPPIPLDTDENLKDKSSSVINLNDREIFAKISSNKLKITECEAELAYKLFLTMLSYYAPDRESDSDIVLKELHDRYKEYVDSDIYDKISNSQRNSTDSPRYQNFSVFFRQDSITSTAQTQNESTPEKTEDTTSEHLYMPMQPIYRVMQPQSSEQIQNIRARANTI